MYVVVYGTSWENVAYFSDERRAYYALFLHTLGAFRCATCTLWPELHAYAALSDGTYSQRWKSYIDLESFEQLMQNHKVADIYEKVDLAIEVSTKIETI